jgi:hypothetical protein
LTKIKKHIAELGLEDSLKFEGDLESLVSLMTMNLQAARRGTKKDSWATIHYKSKKEILVSQNQRCLVCGILLDVGGGGKSSASPELDHIVPFALGGNRPENKRIICKRCNGAKSDNMTLVSDARVSLNSILRDQNRTEANDRTRYWVFERDHSSCSIKLDVQGFGEL